MVLPPGDYRIKYLGVGPPLYATSNGPHRIVTTARGSPGVVERQIVCAVRIAFTYAAAQTLLFSQWKVVTRGPGYVIEVQQHPNDGWFYNEPDKYQPIILDDQEASEFTIESAGDPAHPDVYL